jgi:hypothetical protein
MQVSGKLEAMTSLTLEQQNPCLPLNWNFDWPQNGCNAMNKMSLPGFEPPPGYPIAHSFAYGVVKSEVELSSFSESCILSFG